jgi:hypothetical protein
MKTFTPCPTPSAIRAWLVVAALAPLPAMGGPITFTFQGTGTGTVGATPFTDQSYTITATADTSEVTFNAGIYDLTNSSATIQIAGFSTATFLITTGEFDNQNPFLFDGQEVAALGFTSGGGDLGDLYGATFETYALNGSIGPLFFPQAFGFAAFSDVSTTIGNITFSDEANVTFSAVTAAPEPGPFALIAGGLGGLALARCGRGRARSRASKWRERALGLQSGLRPALESTYVTQAVSGPQAGRDAQ